MKLHYKSFGHGEPVVILHGLFGMLDNWQTFARHLSEDYHVFTPDLRNHGRSPHSDEFNYKLLAGDISEFIEAHKLGAVTLMGHSLGGKTAMQAALTRPELISRLIVVDIAPKTYPPGHDRIIDALLATDPSVTESRSDVEDALMEKLHDKGVVLFLTKNLRRREDGTLSWRMNLSVLAEAYDKTVEEIPADGSYAGPALFVRGERSAYVQDEDMDRITRMFPAATLVTIPNAGHWVHADAMEELLEAVRRFLSSNPV